MERHCRHFCGRAPKWQTVNEESTQREKWACGRCSGNRRTVDCRSNGNSGIRDGERPNRRRRPRRRPASRVVPRRTAWLHVQGPRRPGSGRRWTPRQRGRLKCRRRRRRRDAVAEQVFRRTFASGRTRARLRGPGRSAIIPGGGRGQTEWLSAPFTDAVDGRIGRQGRSSVAFAAAATADAHPDAPCPAVDGSTTVTRSHFASPSTPPYAISAIDHKSVGGVVAPVRRGHCREDASPRWPCVSSLRAACAAVPAAWPRHWNWAAKPGLRSLPGEDRCGAFALFRANARWNGLLWGLFCVPLTILFCNKIMFLCIMFCICSAMSKG